MLSSSEDVVCAGLIIYGHQTRVYLAAEAGCTEYMLDRRQGQLVMVSCNTGNSGHVSLPHTNNYTPIIENQLQKLRPRLRESSQYSRTGVAGVDMITAVKNGGCFVSDQDLYHLHQAVPLAFIGNAMLQSYNHYVTEDQYFVGLKLGCEIYPQDVLNTGNLQHLQKRTQMMTVKNI